MTRTLRPVVPIMLLFLLFSVVTARIVGVSGFETQKNSSSYIKNCSRNTEDCNNQKIFTLHNHDANATTEYIPKEHLPINQYFVILLLPFFLFPSVFFFCVLIRRCLNAHHIQFPFFLQIPYLDEAFPSNFDADRILCKVPEATEKECNKLEDCSVCLNKFILEQQQQLIDEDRVIKLECGHVYHYKCIKKWLNTRGVKSKCPLCGILIVKQEKLNIQNDETEPLLTP